MKILNKPKVNDSISLFVFDLRLKARNMGMIGRMHGDNMEITPVKKEMMGIISI
jgi:hypothetical protein